MHFLGKNLRYLRKQLSKTQSDIALLIKKGQTTVGNWENGISEPNLEELLIISNFFDIQVDVLLKVDLAEVSASQRSVHTVTPYDTSGEEVNIVKEDKLNYVLQEIRNIREEMD